MECLVCENKMRERQTDYICRCGCTMPKHTNTYGVRLGKRVEQPWQHQLINYLQQVYEYKPEWYIISGYFLALIFAVAWIIK